MISAWFHGSSVPCSPCPDKELCRFMDECQEEADLDGIRHDTELQQWDDQGIVLHAEGDHE